MLQSALNFGTLTDLADIKDVKGDIICSQISVDSNADITHFNELPENTVQTEMLDAIPVATCAGYVTIGQAHSFPIDPNSSPNLSINSNDSLISKADRASSRLSVYKSAPLEDLPLSTSPGYVSFKTSEPNVSKTTGYVMVGTVNHSSTTNYIKMGVQTLDKPDSFVCV